jgi:hypothetical protein
MPATVFFETDETVFFTCRLDMMTDVFNRMVSLVYILSSVPTPLTSSIYLVHARPNASVNAMLKQISQKENQYASTDVLENSSRPTRSLERSSGKLVG